MGWDRDCRLKDFPEFDEFYPQALELIAQGRVRIEGNRAIIDHAGG
jgi:hypothetical protein